MSYTSQFPEFDPSTLPTIPSDWEDMSWRNDVCPSWQCGAVRVWIDFADPQLREWGDCERFRITDAEVNDLLFATDDWKAALDFVTSYNLKTVRDFVGA